MNREQINRIIQDNELFHGMMALGVVMDANHLEKFAKIVAAEEREACSILCDELADEAVKDEDFFRACVAQDCAESIRARGE